jgi:hypothetical protein
MLQIRRVVLIGLLSLLSTTPRAEASPVLFQFAHQWQNGPLTGTLFFGSVVFDDYRLLFDDLGNWIYCDVCWDQPNSPILSASLTLGSQSFDLSHAYPGSHFALHINTFGPWLDIRPEFLPGGIDSLWLGSDSVYRIGYTWTDSSGDFYADMTEAGLNPRYLYSLTQLPTQSVPEPTALLFGVGGIAALAIRRRLAGLRR